MEDWKAALDATVLKQGTFTMIFHPHGWIKPEQLVELIEYGVRRHGRKLKFLNFREAQERLNAHLLNGQPLRDANGQDNGVRLLDLNHDGYMDVVIGQGEIRKTRVWNPHNRQWIDSPFPTAIIRRTKQGTESTGVQFGIVQTNGHASMLVRNEQTAGAWDFEGRNWVENKALLAGLTLDGQPVFTRHDGRDRGVRLVDVDRNGRCELVVANESQNAAFEFKVRAGGWKRLPFAFPDGARLTDATGRDLGLRFVDVNEDGFPDLLFSNESGYSLDLFLDEEFFHMPRGWSHRVRSGKPGEAGAIPMISRAGANNGAWIRHRTLWVQNEFTAEKPDLVDRMTFDQMIAFEAPPAKSPEEARATLKAAPGFAVELVASEPLVHDPIAFDWSADGKLWVLEMGDYPLGPDGKGGAGGRVRFLEDTNGDGTYDKSTLFLEGLSIPTGLMPWRNGVLILSAPELFYAEDANGDGKADVKEVLFTGFPPGNPQHRANGFDYGIDNWIYGANGDSGGQITSVKTGRVVDINGRDFRFRPETGEFEAESGQTQYGRHRDDWGNWFGNNNPTWLWHYLFAERYITRNPHLPVKRNKAILANYPDSGRTYAISTALERFNDPSGLEHVTSANSAMPYRDDLFGPDFSRSVFISEPVHNCIHREVLVDDGVTFTSHRAKGEEKSEFLASTDPWFRPTMLRTGPDGALYLADMYRLVIEHPEWIALDRQKQLDLRAGADRGRIYRVVPEKSARRPFPNLARMTTAQWVQALDSPNGWQRDTAQRLLVERGGTEAVEALRRLAHSSARSVTRLHALATLEGLHQLTANSVIAALNDSDSRLREHAVRLSEPFLRRRSKDDDELLKAVLGRVHDSSARVRYQLAFSLGESGAPEAGRALAEIARNDWRDPHLRLAVMSSATNHLNEMVNALMHDQERPEGLVEQLLSLALALHNNVALKQLVSAVVQPKNDQFEPWQFDALAGLLDALERKGQSLSTFVTEAEGIQRHSGEL